MAAYVISDLEPLDPVLIAEYRALAQVTIAQYGGRYLVRGGAVEPVEGGWTPQNIVVVEFPSMAQAREWYRSPEYAKALVVRRHALNRRLIFVDGVKPVQPASP
jgi:uncharacterized protein (DUF1330 family)